MNLALGVLEVRKRLGISQGLLAKEAGISQTFLSQIETGKRNYSLTMINKLMEALPVANIKIIYASILIEDIAIMNRGKYRILKPILDKILEQIV